MPDFDIDFCQEDEEVIRYVQENMDQTELPKSLPLDFAGSITDG